MSRSLRFQRGAYTVYSMTSRILFVLIGGLLFGAVFSACQRPITPLSLADPRLPSQAKRRIADAEDAVEVAIGDLAEAQRERARAEARQARSAAAPPPLAAAAGPFSALQQQRVMSASATETLAATELALADARLNLIYAETALRYDLAVYPLEPLRAAVEVRRAAFLQARSAWLESRQRWQEALDRWWTSYRGVAAAAQRDYWRRELVP